MESEGSTRSRTFIVASGGYETQVRIHDQNMQLVRSLQFPDMQVLHLAFSGLGPAHLGDRVLLAVAGSPKIGIYDISIDAVAEIPFFMYGNHQGAVTAVGFEPYASEFLYSSSEDGTLQVWVPVAQGAGGGHQDDAAQHAMHGRPPSSRATLRTFYNKGPANLVPINDVVFYPPKMLYFAIDAIGRLRIWDQSVPENQGDGLRREFKPHRSGRHLQCIDMSSDYSIVVMANLDGFVFIYRVHDLLEAQAPVPAVIRASESYIPRVRLSHSANLLACPLTSSGIKIFRMRDIIFGGEQGGDGNGGLQQVAPVQQFGDRPGWIWDVAFVGDSEEYLIACSSNTQIMLWNLKDMPKSAEFPPSRKAVICVAVKEIILDEPEPETGEPEVHHPLVAGPDAGANGLPPNGPN